MVVGLGKLTLITFLRPRDKLYGSRPYTGISTLPAQLFSLSCMYQSLVLPTLDYCMVVGLTQAFLHCQPSCSHSVACTNLWFYLLWITVPLYGTLITPSILTNLLKPFKNLQPCRMVTKNWQGSYVDLLTHFQWPTLSTRRRKQKAALCYRILNNNTPSFLVLFLPFTLLL